MSLLAASGTDLQPFQKEGSRLQLQMIGLLWLWDHGVGRRAVVLRRLLVRFAGD